MHYIHKTQDTCSQFIEFDLEDGVVRNIVFHGGCSGNLAAISKLLEGASAAYIEQTLLGNLCGRRPTSCADQLARAVREASRAQAEL